VSEPRFLIIGAGPAGTAAATVAASLGAQVSLVERTIFGGAAHLLDCIPSKTMVATALRLGAVGAAGRLGVVADEVMQVDTTKLTARIAAIRDQLSRGTIELLTSQAVELVTGTAHFTSQNQVEVTGAAGIRQIEFDIALIATGSDPRIPDWASFDGERILTTRQAYSLAAIPTKLVVIGSGVTGVEFTHIFSSLGARVSLIVSRQQVLPHRDPEVASVLEEDFLERGVVLHKGARASRIVRQGDEVLVECADGRAVRGSHALVAVGSVPNTSQLGLEAAAIATKNGNVVVDEWQRTSIPHVYAAGDVTGQHPLSSVAAMQGRKIALHALGERVTPIDHAKTAEAIFTEPEIAWVGLEEAAAAAQGRRVRITKVPFSANARATIQSRTRGFVKLITDPATHVLLGGTIVGHYASELISVIALAVQAKLRVDALAETLLVYPSLSEALNDAAE